MRKEKLEEKRGRVEGGSTARYSAKTAGSPEECMAERIMTLHPQGKQGVNIDKSKYDTIRQAIEETLHAQPEATFSELTAAVDRRIGDAFDGSVNWYVTTVKLDLEARGLLARVDDRSPQRLRLAGPNAEL